MASVLYTSTFGSDDPTRATIAFVAALGALDAGHQAQIALLGEATYLMKDYIVEQIHGVGWGALKDLLTRVIAQGVPIYV
jgi:uncharacterized protein